MSIKQLILDMSSEARKEIKELIDFIEGNNTEAPAAEETPVVDEVPAEE